MPSFVKEIKILWDGCDLKTGINRIYASSRRNPPQSSLDNTPFNLWRIKKLDKNTFLLLLRDNRGTNSRVYIFDKTKVEIKKITDMPNSFFEKYTIKCIAGDEPYDIRKVLSFIFKTEDNQLFTCGFRTTKKWYAQKNISKIVSTIDFGEKYFKISNFKEVFEIAENSFFFQDTIKIDGITRGVFLVVNDKINFFPIHFGSNLPERQASKALASLVYTTNLYSIGKVFLLSPDNQGVHLIVPKKSITGK